ncbi:MAG TPA: DnaJ domain-containing protein [Enhygromyxa sp.]|nr:DnaJ domain-containing protein [Enhygromyxa sp.]
MSGTGSRTISLDPGNGGISVPRLYFALLRQRFTGTVTLTQREPAGARTVWFRGGMPVFTDWVSEADRLGDLLLRAGLVDAAGLARALAAHASGNGRLGEILVGLQLLDEAARTEMLRDQCVRKLVRSFAIEAVAPEASVTAIEHGLGHGDELSQINTLALLLQGVAAHYDDDRIAAELGEGLAGDLVATPALTRYERQFGFEAGDAPILAALARGVSMARLLAPGIDLHRARTIIYTLWATQMLRLGDDAIQAIAKGATAAAAAAELGVTLGSQSTSPQARTSSSRTAQRAKPPEPKPPESKPSAAPKRLESKPLSKPEPVAEAQDDSFEVGLVALEARVAEQANAFALFGLEPDADRKQIREVWAELSKTYHPDALEGAGRSALRDRVERVFAALSEAYGVLSDKDQREQLREALAVGGSLKAGEDTAAVVRNAFEAELLARDADKLLAANQWARAAELFARAHALSPKDSDVEAALIYAEFRRDSGDATATVAKLATLLAETPNCARAHYFKGLLELSLGDTSSAKQSFSTAHKLNPRNIDAERQLRAIMLRERDANPRPDPKDDKNRGFSLRGLFKK